MKAHCLLTRLLGYVFDIGLVASPMPAKFKMDLLFKVVSDYQEVINLQKASVDQVSEAVGTSLNAFVSFNSHQLFGLLLVFCMLLSYKLTNERFDRLAAPKNCGQKIKCEKYFALVR